MAVGPITGADGTIPSTVRSAKSGEAVITQAHGKYYEASSRGKMFAACTPAAGATPGTAVGTTAAFSLFNPANSGYRVAIKKVNIGYLSGTLGAGTVFHCGDNANSQSQ